MTLQKIEFMYDIPDGYRFVRYGFPRDGEQYLCNNRVRIASWDYDSEEWPIVEKIPEQEQSNEELKLQFKNGDGEWIDLISDYEYRIKPKTKTIRFRNWISCNGNVYVASDIEQIGQNYKWLGDWQNVEIEENE